MADAAITVPATVLRDLPSGYSKRARLSVIVPELPGYIVEPIHGYRPVCLLGVVPPATEDLLPALDAGSTPAAELEPQLD